jgi:hypothetical protein
MHRSVQGNRALGAMNQYRRETVRNTPVNTCLSNVIQLLGCASLSINAQRSVQMNDLGGFYERFSCSNWCMAIDKFALVT